MKPIIFSTPMVQAILEGRKTQTRRIIKSRHESGMFSISTAQYEPNCRGYYHNRCLCSIDWDERTVDGGGIFCPYGEVGDIIYVRETFCWDWLDYPKRTKKYYVYKATTPDYVFASGEHWLPSIHMPKEAARLFLKITDIRVEKLQDISEEDAEAEGVEWRIMGKEFGRLEGQRLYKDYINPTNTDYGPVFAKDSFNYLWQSINGPESWEENPWVWVINFERIEKPL